MKFVNKFLPTAATRGKSREPMRGAHDAKIEAVLDSVVFSGDAPVFDVPLIVLAFVNRSGSNLLGEYLQSVDGLGGFGEMLNWNTVGKVARSKGIATFPDYIRHLVEHQGGAQGFGVKASGPQLAMLVRWNILAMFPAVKVIHIQREDAVAQAVSMHFASSTGAWFSRLETDEPINLDYDFDKLNWRLENVFKFNRKIELVCAAAALDRHTIIYEQMTDRTAMTIRYALEFLGIEADEWKAPKRTAMQKQERSEKAEMVRRFREELAGVILA